MPERPTTWGRSVRFGRMTKKVSKTFGGAITPHGGLRVGLRDYFSTVYLHAAKTQHGSTEKLEKAHSGSSKYDEDHRVLVLSSVISSFAFLEAMVNELFQDAADGHNVTNDGYLAPLDAGVIRRLADYWNWTGGRDPLLVKYDRLLEASSAMAIKGTARYENVDRLRRLRNALVHFTPRTSYADTQTDLERRLKGLFADNALMTGAGNAWYPSHCLGAGCALWAYQTAEGYAREVCARLDIRPNFVRLTRLSVDQVAEILDVSKSTLQKWRSKGAEPRHEKHHGRVTYREQEVYKVMAQRGVVRSRLI